MLGWLARLVIAFAILGLLAFDGIKVVVANFGAADDATTAANAALDSYQADHNVQHAYNAAVASVAGKGDVIETANFTITAGGAVSLTLDRTPATLWMQRISAFHSVLSIRQTATARPAVQ